MRLGVLACATGSALRAGKPVAAFRVGLPTLGPDECVQFIGDLTLTVVGRSADRSALRPTTGRCGTGCPSAWCRTGSARLPGVPTLDERGGARELARLAQGAECPRDSGARRAADRRRHCRPRIGCVRLAQGASDLPGARPPPRRDRAGLPGRLGTRPIDVGSCWSTGRPTTTAHRSTRRRCARARNSSSRSADGRHFRSPKTPQLLLAAQRGCHRLVSPKSGCTTGSGKAR